MTEEEWQASCEPERLLAHLETSVSLRKARLFGVACCRRVLHLNFSPEVPRALNAAEAFADGLTTDEERQQVIDATSDACAFAAGAFLGVPNHTLPYDGDVAFCLLKAVGELFSEDGCRSASPAKACSEAVWLAGESNGLVNRHWEEIEQVKLLRDIFGNPFRPVAFDPAWRTDTAVSLARGMYDSRDFSAMPILADALQDAGCEDEQVLNHCRDATAPHVRGCWVCDAVLSLG